MRKKQTGFSLIELLIVVAIILIIAAIAIPNLLRSKMVANEASAVGSLRSLNTACITYSTTYGSYPPAISNLGPAGSGGATSTTADLIDQVLALGGKSGYVFSFTPGTANLSYQLNADPVTRGTTGQRSFFTDASGVIRSNVSAVASNTDTPI
jgi:type IV pilus assembly protein PilA